MPKLVPPMTMLELPLPPITPCHWKPNSAVLPPRHLDDQALDVDLGAALVELVDHGAHLPIERLGGGDDQRIGRRVGLDEAAGGRSRGGADRRRRSPTRCRWRRRCPPRRPEWWVAASSSPRCPTCRRRCRSRRRTRRAAPGRSLVASAFFRCTTQMLPLAAEPCGGRSSLAISERIARHLAGVGAAHDQRVAARVDQDRRRRACRAPAPAPRERRRGAAVAQALQQRLDVGRRPHSAAGSPRRRRRPACPWSR